MVRGSIPRRQQQAILRTAPYCLLQFPNVAASQDVRNHQPVNASLKPSVQSADVLPIGSIAPAHLRAGGRCGCRATFVVNRQVCILSRKGEYKPLVCIVAILFFTLLFRFRFFLASEAVLLHFCSKIVRTSYHLCNRSVLNYVCRDEEFARTLCPKRCKLALVQTACGHENAGVIFKRSAAIPNGAKHV